MIATLILAAAAFLAGHWTAPEHVVTVPVHVPVPVECREPVPDRPPMPTEQFAQKPDLHEFAKSALAEIEIREGYETQLRTALEACTAPIQP